MKKLTWTVASLVTVAALSGCGTRIASLSTESAGLSAMSKAPGVKRALLVGINQYQLPGANLHGCVNDVDDAKAQMLTPQGFQNANITTLTDAKATRANIMSALKSLVASAKAGDFLYFHYSGHGSQVPDTNGDESDGQDEIICPTDLKVAGDTFQNAILDDEIQSVLGQLKPGVGFLMISDSCNSGTIDQLRIHGLGALKARGLTLPTHARNLTPISYSASAQTTFRARVNGGQYVVITGCQDDQTSADAYINNRYNGALTYYLLDAFKKGPKTYGEWHQNILAGLEQNGYDQRPNLIGSATLAPFSLPQ